MPEREYVVGVFRHEGVRKPHYMAYVRYFNAAWKGCCVHKVVAESGQAAKALAIRNHRAVCDPEASRG